MNKNKNKIAVLIMSFIYLLLILSPTISFAESPQAQTSYSTKTIGSDVSKINEQDLNKSYVNEENPLPNYTIDQASSWVDKKGFELIGFLQRIVQPFAILIFICCAIMTMLGAFGRGEMAGKGIVGMIVAGVMYVVILYAPELIAFFLNWVRS